jgi:HSP20 family protein
MRFVTPFITRNLYPDVASDFFQDMDRMIGDFNVPTTFDQQTQWAAHSEISEATDHYLLSVDLPGLKNEDIKIEAHENTLTISGERKREMTVNKNQNNMRTEKFYGSFKRSYVIPSLAKNEDIEANYQDGVLQVYIPKTKSAQPTKIEVKAGKPGFFDKLSSAKNEKAPKDQATAEETTPPNKSH